jgi:hypothetical protein
MYILKLQNHILLLTLLCGTAFAKAQGSGSNIPEKNTAPVSAAATKVAAAAEITPPPPPAQPPLYVGEMRKYHIPQMLVYTEQGSTRGTALRNAEQSHGFYPIGWSNDHRFAYLIDYAAAAKQDTHHVEFVIQNVVFNEVAYSWRGQYPLEMLDLQKEGNAAIAVRNENVNILWQNRYGSIRRKLSDFHIRQPKDFNWMVGTSFKHGDDNYTINADITAEGEIKGTIPRARITMQCSKGSRFLYVRNNTDEKPLKVVVHGTMISPYEARGVVISEIFFEGDSPETPRRQLRLTGFDLVNNFENEAEKMKKSDKE